jgi:transcriptional regulator with XRE-family HTH domain
MLAKVPKAVDLVVGNNIRVQRLAKKMSQEKLAASLGLSFQQVQKYEKGANRVGGSRMVQIAEILKVPITALFAGTNTAKLGAGNAVQLLVAKPGALRLLNAYSKISKASTRQLVVKLAEQLGADSTDRN